MTLKLDPHYSHKTPAVLALVRQVSTLPLFVPAGCTDIVQECDTVTNKPFKSGVKGEFRDHLHRDLEKLCRDNPESRPSEWAPNLSMSGLKPLVVSFVEAGLRALETPEMKATTTKAFAEDGRFREIGGEETQSAARVELLTEAVNEPVFVPDDVEESREDEEPALAADTGGDDSDEEEDEE